MLITDDDRRYVAVNDAACHLLKRERNELIGATIDSLTPDVDLDQIDDAWQSFLKIGSLYGQQKLIDGHGDLIVAEFNSSANILPGRHLTIFFVGDRTEVEVKTVVDSNLSPRELQILTMIASGNRGVEIADLLALSPDTVRVHVRNAMRKLDARTRSHAVAEAFSRGLISLEEN